MSSLNDALKFLELEPKYSFQDLKSHFRRVSFRVHPDYDGSEEAFNQLMDYYKILEKNVVNFENKKVENFIINGVTVEGHEINDLGKGYPITENAVTCDICGGKGYISFRVEHSKKYVECDECFGIGIVSYPCKKCDGTGDYSRNGKIIGVCNLCNGSKRFYPVNKRYSRHYEKINYIPHSMNRGINCKKCDGYGNIWIPVYGNEMFHSICNKCEGIGEIKIFNPVLPRGLFANNK